MLRVFRFVFAQDVLETSARYEESGRAPSRAIRRGETRANAIARLPYEIKGTRKGVNEIIFRERSFRIRKRERNQRRTTSFICERRRIIARRTRTWR